MTATQAQPAKSHILSKKGEKPMTFTKISSHEVSICYGSESGCWVKDEYHSPVITIHPVSFARTIWKQYKAMGWN